MRTSLVWTVHFDGTPLRGVRDAVEIAADRDHAVAADAPFQLQHGLKRPSRKWLELGTFFGENARPTTRLVVAWTRALATWSSQ